MNISPIGENTTFPWMLGKVTTIIPKKPINAPKIIRFETFSRRKITDKRIVNSGADANSTPAFIAEV